MPRRERPVEEAMDHLRHDHPKKKFRITGLKKVCPRCGRQGHVFLDASGDTARFAICWDGPSRLAQDKVAVEIGFANPRAVADFDIALKLEDLFRPSMGCGYDKPKAR